MTMKWTVYYFYVADVMVEAETEEQAITKAELTKDMSPPLGWGMNLVGVEAEEQKDEH